MYRLFPSNVSNGPGMVGAGRKRFLRSLLTYDGGSRSCRGVLTRQRERISRQTSLFFFLLWRNVREVAQILVHGNRADHLHYVRPLCARRVLLAVRSAGLLDLLCATLTLGEQRHCDTEDAKHRSS